MGMTKSCKKCSKPKRPRGKTFEGKEGYCECGRPPKVTPDIVKKLEEAAAIDASVEEMCFYAGISRQTYYNYVREKPEFVDRVEALRQNPVLTARKTVVGSLQHDSNTALRYLEKKRSDEFGIKQKIEHSGAIEVADLTEKMSGEEKEALEKLREARKKRIQAESRKIK